MHPGHLRRTPFTSNSLQQGRSNYQVETALRPHRSLGGRLWDLTSTIRYELSSPSEKVMTELGHIIININLEHGHLIEDTDRGLVGDKSYKGLRYPCRPFYLISSPRFTTMTVSRPSRSSNRLDLSCSVNTRRRFLRHQTYIKGKLQDLTCNPR